MGEQQSQTTAAAELVSMKIACPHAEAVGKRWGDPLDEELQLDLQNYLDQWAKESDHGDRVGPFQKVTLSGAEVFWLAERVRNELGDVPDLRLEGASLRMAHLEGASLRGAHLEGAALSEAQLAGANLRGTHLERAYLSGAHLEGADLSLAHLSGAALYDAHMNGADLSGTYLEGAHLRGAQMKGADLNGAHLTGAYVQAAQLERAFLTNANIEGADLRAAQLAAADLHGAWLDSKTVLSDSALDKQTSLGDIHWSGVGAVNLTQIRWERVPTLGDEMRVGHHAKVTEHEAVVRAYRQVAAQLRAQGLSEVADRFLYRAQVHQRTVLRKQHKVGGYLFSLLLALLAGYGYRLGRIIIAYALIVGVFAAAFLASDVVSGHATLSVPKAFDALQISLNAIHGRVFFAQFHLDTLQSWLATTESIIGIIIEGVFVAMLIQRFFAR